MVHWLTYLSGGVALMALAPLAALAGHRYGRSIKGGLILASVLLGFGQNHSLFVHEKSCRKMLQCTAAHRCRNERPVRDPLY